MDSTGTFEVCECLSTYKMITALHKFYKPEEYNEFYQKQIHPDNFMISTGINDEAIEKIKRNF